MVKIVELREDAELLENVGKRFPHAELRRYQADIANRVYESLSAGSRSVLLEGPTGLGKGL
ncbi:MAG: DEAD/DEAH box helicase family protein [Candidatus Caldarchaeum sp.]